MVDAENHIVFPLGWVSIPWSKNFYDADLQKNLQAAVERCYKTGFWPWKKNDRDEPYHGIVVLYKLLLATDGWKPGEYKPIGEDETAWYLTALRAGVDVLIKVCNTLCAMTLLCKYIARFRRYICDHAVYK